jgi:hypothetical protein
MTAHKLINQSSGNTEWYTPLEIVAAARRAMGGIDLDPASSQRANDCIVKATRFYEAPGYSQYIDPAIDTRLPVRHYHGQGGLDREWHGRIWLNHPFGNGESACKPGCKKKVCPKRGYHLGTDLPGSAYWIRELLHEVMMGNVTEAYTICFAATSENWFKPLKIFPMCLIDGRVNYLDPETLQPVRGVTKGSVVFYLGTNLNAFYDNFKQFGAIYVPMLSRS